MSFTLIDDRDSSISYKGTWVVGGTAHEYKGTVSSSVTVGDSFTVPFTGTSIGVYGTTDSSSNLVRTAYAIDGNTADVVITTGAAGSDAYHKLFWQSGKLTNADHKLVVTMRAVNTGQGAGEGTIWFDFFNVTTPATTSVTPLPSNSATAPASKSVASQTKSKAASTSSESPSSTSAPIVVSDPPKSTSHAGLIAGLIVALIAILTLAGAYYWYRRRRPRSSYFPRKDEAASPPPMTPMGALPTSTESAYPPQIPPSYGIGDVVSLGVTGASFGQGYAPLGSRSPSEYNLTLDPPRTQSQSQSALSVSSAQTSTRGPLSVANPSPLSDPFSDSIADLKRRQQEVVKSYEDGINTGAGAGPSLIQHVDSGVRSLPMRHDEHPSSGPIELPPVYTPN